MIVINKLQPETIVKRTLLIDLLHQISQRDIALIQQCITENKLEGEYLESFDEILQGGKEVTIVKLNYEWLLFYATNFQLENLAGRFIKVPPKEKPTGKIIGMDGKIIESEAKNMDELVEDQREQLHRREPLPSIQEVVTSKIAEDIMNDPITKQVIVDAVEEISAEITEYSLGQEELIAAQQKTEEVTEENHLDKPEDLPGINKEDFNVKLDEPWSPTGAFVEGMVKMHEVYRNKVATGEIDKERLFNVATKDYADKIAPQTGDMGFKGDDVLRYNGEDWRRFF